MKLSISPTGLDQAFERASDRGVVMSCEPASDIHAKDT